MHNYGYTGSVQAFTAPIDGTYRLEVWGAQGGNDPCATGGYGGYSIGNISLLKGQTLYIVVGGNGDSTNGFNGGGRAFSSMDYGSITYYGGGATHIATTNRGTLQNYSSYRTDVLIVAGGGGSAGMSYYDTEDEVYRYKGSAGGTGGGLSGGNGGSRDDDDDNEIGIGGTQTTGYSFGIGGSGSNYYSGAGGGGWYGGTMGQHNRHGGGGGSGYIGGVTSGSTVNGQKTGHGAARITII